MNEYVFEKEIICSNCGYKNKVRSDEVVENEVVR